MNIVHFDVDENIAPYLTGTNVSYSLQEYHNDDISKIEAVSIKLASNADKTTLSRFANLKVLITRTVGTDHIDLDYCKVSEIAVYHIVDYGAFNIAEHTFALLLSGTRNIISSQNEIKQGIFSFAHHLGISLKGKTLGVVGTGRIGLEVIKRAKSFEMKIIAYDVMKNETAAREVGYEYVSLENLALESDIITLHAPLMESTFHMINETVIEKMKEGVVLINTARGGLMDTKALIKYINKFRFVGLDVLEDEQVFTKDHPLLKFPQVLITPHIAFYSDASVKKIAEETHRLFTNFEKGDKEGRVL